MAQYNKKRQGGFVNRLLMGAEKSEGFARASLPSNRWELFWDILKNNFGKMVLINLMICVFCIPVVLVFFFRHVLQINLGTQYPFSHGFGVGYQAPIDLSSMPESIAFNSNLMSFLLMPIAMCFLAIGLSGGAYIMRNLVWTEGIFVANDFWKGIKQNFKTILIICALYSIVFYLSVCTISFFNLWIATSVKLSWLLWVGKIACIIVLILYSIMSLHMVTMTVTYQTTFKQLLKNSFYTTFALLIHNVIFIVLGLVPCLLLLLGSFFYALGIVIVILFAFSFFLLVWTNYCQWIYDRYINDKVPGATKNKGIYQKVKADGSIKQADKLKQQMDIAMLSSLSSKPIKPITDEELQLAELPESFNRADIERLNQSRKALYEDNEKYIQEHANDEYFVKIAQANEKNIANEKERQERISKAQRELAKRKKKK